MHYNLTLYRIGTDLCNCVENAYIGYGYNNTFFFSNNTAFNQPSSCRLYYQGRVDDEYARTRVRSKPFIKKLLKTNSFLELIRWRN